MEALEYWSLSAELTVRRAALLILDCDPAEYSPAENWRDDEKLPKAYEAVKNAISHALQRREIVGRIVPHFRNDFEDQVLIPIDGTTDASESTVEVVSLRAWLLKHDIKTGFFSRHSTELPDYMNPQHPRYALKLAAAVRAWSAVEGDAAIRGKSPKQALMKWLREHAAELALTDAAGVPNENGIQEVAKVANWQMMGGAPKSSAS